ncbi:uncharacterized protein LY89DRAFT_662572 [Mollisia scopiformis]|uniref:Uncharacterized protein n=1 Tax=Mollisia scopiformis TaxID=149040 RepID=A0A194XTX1_MOLSC|nr:uncharacterized protein LY89DRAFT_662572 [Mollisia scopiformis]KUJ23770.1 hypothetical protein LY89DRAFT_662572 [Mollisia scopiformis]
MSEDKKFIISDASPKEIPDLTLPPCISPVRKSSGSEPGHRDVEHVGRGPENTSNDGTTQPTNSLEESSQDHGIESTYLNTEPDPRSVATIPNSRAASEHPDATGQPSSAASSSASVTIPNIQTITLRPTPTPPLREQLVRNVPTCPPCHANPGNSNCRGSPAFAQCRGEAPVPDGSQFAIHSVGIGGSGVGVVAGSIVGAVGGDVSGSGSCRLGENSNEGGSAENVGGDGFDATDQREEPKDGTAGSRSKKADENGSNGEKTERAGGDESVPDWGRKGKERWSMQFAGLE